MVRLLPLRALTTMGIDVARNQDAPPGGRLVARQFDVRPPDVPLVQVGHVKHPDAAAHQGSLSQPRVPRDMASRVVRASRPGSEAVFERRGLSRD